MTVKGLLWARVPWGVRLVFGGLSTLLLGLIFMLGFGWPALMSMLIAGFAAQVATNLLWRGAEAITGEEPLPVLTPERQARLRAAERAQEARRAAGLGLPWLDFEEGRVLPPAEALAWANEQEEPERPAGEEILRVGGSIAVHQALTASEEALEVWRRAVERGDSILGGRTAGPRPERMHPAPVVEWAEIRVAESAEPIAIVAQPAPQAYTPPVVSTEAHRLIWIIAKDRNQVLADLEAGRIGPATAASLLRDLQMEMEEAFAALLGEER